MNLHLRILLYFLCLYALESQAQSFEFNATCERAYTNIIALKLDSGKFYLQAEQKANPANYIPILLYNYIDFLEVYTSGSLSLYETKKKSFDERLNVLKNGDKNSPYYLYAQAEVHTQAAVMHIKFGEYVATIFDVKRALKKLEANQVSYPDFLPNAKSLGMLNAILGSIPSQYQNTLEFIGLNGDVNKGMKLLKQSAESKEHPFQHEAATIYAFMLLHIQNAPNSAWKVLQNNKFNSKTSLMDAYSLGHIGVYGNYCDAGIAALQSRPTSTSYASFPLCDFLLGIGKTYRIDGDANVYFKKFLNTNQGADYIKSSWHKMAWNELIVGNTAKYQDYLAKVKNSGREVIDTDKQAVKEAESMEIPNPILLQARLLSDGNYLIRALKMLQTNTVNSFKSRFDKTEYFYRLARIYDKSNQVSLAIQYYGITISNGKKVPYYYAANAAYLLGFLYEQQGNKTLAIGNYKLCLVLEGYEYENSIHQKAEAALNRLK